MLLFVVLSDHSENQEEDFSVPRILGKCSSSESNSPTFSATNLSSRHNNIDNKHDQETDDQLGRELMQLLGNGNISRLTRAQKAPVMRRVLWEGL